MGTLCHLQVKMQEEVLGNLQRQTNYKKIKEKLWHFRFK